MRLFWKVSSCNFKYFVSYISNKYSDCNINGLKKMNRYYTNGDDNLYICVEKKNKIFFISVLFWLLSY